MAKFIALSIIVAFFLACSMLAYHAGYKRHAERMRAQLLDTDYPQVLVEWFDELDWSAYDNESDNFSTHIAQESWPPITGDLKPVYVLLRKKPKMASLRYGGGLSYPYGYIICEDPDAVRELYQDDYLLEVNNRIVVWFDLGYV